jgi:hypothetical protein
MASLYFANEPREKIASVLHSKVQEWYEAIERQGRLNIWRKVHRYYHALNTQGVHEASQISRTGEQGELSVMKANHYRNLLQHLHVLTTQQRPSFECRALNTDVKSQVQTILGRNILEYYLRERRLDVEYRYAAEVAIAYAESYTEIEWDREEGDDVAVDEEAGKIIKTGDIRATVYEPIDVVRQLRSNREKQQWYIMRRWVNRWDLAARYPEYAEYIEKFSETAANDQFYYYNAATYSPTPENEDLIPVYRMYHERTPACPMGRFVEFLGSELCLEYDVLQYDTVPVFPMIPSRQHGTSFGYSVSFDLLCVQEAIDLLYSTVLSNQAAFGVQNVWMPPGADISATQLAGGLNIIESPQKPEPINLTNTPPEIFNFTKAIEQLGETLSGVNSVARGQPEASLKSGAALALIASQAVQFSNGLQAAYARLLEDTGTCILRTLTTRATLPRAAVIAGKNNKSYMKDFTGDDLRSINRVIVDLGNPVSRTVAGRIQMAQDMLQAQVIQKPEQYIQVIETGSTEPMIDEQRAQELLVDSENEALQEGRPVMAIATDKHQKHIDCHASVLAGAAERMDPALVQRVLAHINEHINLLRTTDPALLNLLGQAPIAVQPNGMPTPPQGQNAPQPNAQPQGPGAPTPQPGEQVVAAPGSGPEIQANMPDMPKAPAVEGMPAA